MKKITTAIVLITTTFLTAGAQANPVDLGEIDLTGTFTLNHNFNFNNPAAAPFGTFGTLTVGGTSGIFLPYVNVGDTFQMNTPSMFGDSTPVSGTPSQPMIWSIDGFTLNTTLLLITGADFAGRFCFGGTDLSGNGFDPSAYHPFGASSNWNFTAPPYDISNFPADITGPINMTIHVGYDDGHVPDGGTALLLFGIGIAGVEVLRRKLIAHTG